MDHQQSIQNAINYIEAHLSEPILLSDVSKHAFKSLSYLHRVFYFTTGYTLKEYIRNRRLSEAASQLRCANTNITDIALQAGFQTLESFSRAFSKHYHVSPSQFRKHRQEQVLFKPLR